MYHLRSKWLWSLIMGIFGIAPGRHCAQSAFRPAHGRHSALTRQFSLVGIRERPRIYTPHFDGYKNKFYNTTGDSEFSVSNNATKYGTECAMHYFNFFISAHSAAMFTNICLLYSLVMGRTQFIL